MSGWNGAGVFSLPYLFVQDSANGIKILSSRQDTQWATVVAGLNNVMCKDGQNSAIANLNMGGNKLTNMANGSATTDAVAYGQLAGALLSGSQFRKNWLLNGAMQISQRFVATVAAVNATNEYVLDRWQAKSGGGQVANFSQQTPGASLFQFFQRVQRPSGSAVTTIQLAQSLETLDSAAMQGLTVTLSFWARAGATYSPTSGDLNASVYTGTGTDENVLTGYTGSAQPINANVVLTAVWQRFQVTASLSAAATEVGCVFTMTPVGAAGATDYFDITGVQLEVASAATDYDFQPYGLMLYRCKRYYQKSFVDSVIPAQGTTDYRGAAYAIAGKAGANSEFIIVYLECALRTAPASWTVVTFNPQIANAQARDNSAGDCSATGFSVGWSGRNVISFSANGNAATAVGNQLFLHWTLAAEL